MFKAVKKALKKSVAKKKPAAKNTKKNLLPKKKAAVTKKEKPIGKVTHYFGKIRVAVVKFSKDVRVGSSVVYRGATTDFSDTIKSMQKDHVPVKTAKKGSSVGIKVKRKVRVGDCVFEDK